MKTDPVQPLHGGVVLDPGQHAHGIVELLTYHLRDRVTLAYYDHPYAIEVSRRHPFMIVFSAAAAAGVVRVYRVRRMPPPLVLHVDDPETLAAIDYDDLCDGAEVVPVAQADLLQRGPDVTLRIDLFREVVEQLERRYRQW